MTIALRQQENDNFWSDEAFNMLILFKNKGNFKTGDEE